MGRIIEIASKPKPVAVLQVAPPLPRPRTAQRGNEGPIGPMPAHEWHGTTLALETAPGEWGEPVDLRGLKGDKGDKGESVKGDPGLKGDSIKGDEGPIGPMPAHEWNGTQLRFEAPDGSWGEAIDLQGPRGLKGDPGKTLPALPPLKASAYKFTFVRDENNLLLEIVATPIEA